MSSADTPSAAFASAHRWRNGPISTGNGSYDTRRQTATLEVLSDRIMRRRRRRWMPHAYSGAGRRGEGRGCHRSGSLRGGVPFCGCTPGPLRGRAAPRRWSGSSHCPEEAKTNSRMQPGFKRGDAHVKPPGADTWLCRFGVRAWIRTDSSVRFADSAQMSPLSPLMSGFRSAACDAHGPPPAPAAASRPPPPPLADVPARGMR